MLQVNKLHKILYLYFDTNGIPYQGAIRSVKVKLPSGCFVCIAPHGCFITPEYIAGRKACMQLASYCCIDDYINITIHE